MTVLPRSQLALRELEKCLDALETLRFCGMVNSTEQMNIRVRLLKRADKLGFEFASSGFQVVATENESP